MLSQFPNYFSRAMGDELHCTALGALYTCCRFRIAVDHDYDRDGWKEADDETDT